MDNPRRVGRAESVHNLAGMTDYLRHAQAARRDQFQERDASDIFHHHELRIAVGNDVVNSDDVGMVERGRGLRLQKAFGGAGPGRRTCWLAILSWPTVD